MKHWSRYNRIFRSDKLGRFLYNALTGVILELDEVHYRIAENLISYGQSYDHSTNDKAFINFLEEKCFLTEGDEEQVKLMDLHYKRNVACIDKKSIMLTICPTLTCNFTCPYCFQNSQDDATIMNSDTMDAVVSFIEKHHDTRNLSVSWYGGEPTLAFDVIKNLTKRFLELFPDYGNAGLVTNAYLLDKEKVTLLEELKITSVQITLDGTEATHNTRRMLKEGRPTYRKILNNIDFLMQSGWRGECNIRVNIDRKNQQEYAIIRAELLERYKGKKLSVYPGVVRTFLNHPYDYQCGFCDNDLVEFTVTGYEKDGIVPRGGFFPGSGAQNTCIATNYYGYVIGPKGEIYKCWEDVGKKHMVIGSVYDKDPADKSKIEIQYIIGTDPFNDSTCMKCPVMPICGGGCVNKRLLRKQFGEKGIKHCSPLKDSLTSYLEAYIHTFQTNEICAIILGKGSKPNMEKGYRMIQPI